MKQWYAMYVFLSFYWHFKKLFNTFHQCKRIRVYCNMSVYLVIFGVDSCVNDGEIFSLVVVFRVAGLHCFDNLSDKTAGQVAPVWIKEAQHIFHIFLFVFWIDSYSNNRLLDEIGCFTIRYKTADDQIQSGQMTHLCFCILGHYWFGYGSYHLGTNHVIWTHTDLMLNGPLKAISIEICIIIQTFPSRRITWKYRLESVSYFFNPILSNACVCTSARSPLSAASNGKHFWLVQQTWMDIRSLSSHDVYDRLWEKYVCSAICLWLHDYASCH